MILPSYLVLFPILIAMLAYLLPRRFTMGIVMLYQIIAIITAVVNFFWVKENGVIIQSLGGWQRNVGITLKMDELTTVFVMLTQILFMANLLFDYKRKYINNLFLFLFMLLQGLITAIFLSRDLFNLFVLVEVSTVLVSVLIMFKRDSQAIYDGMIYFLINTVAMTFFLFGTGILYKITGVIDLDSIAESLTHINNKQSLILPYAFIITTVCLKAAMVPLFSWLPKAHGTASAPGIVSAILSGLYVKVGLYLFIRIQETIGLQFQTANLFLIIGFITAIIGFVFAVSQKDIKLILAYSTISQVGLIMMALNLDSFNGYWGGIYHILNHAIFKTILFLSAGVIIDEYKTRNVHEIKDVFKRMPVISIAVILAILGITGAPFFNGSISKYWISYGAKDSLAEFGLLLVNLGTIIIFIKFSTIFRGRGGKTILRAKLDGYTSVTAVILGILCFMGGLFGQQFIYFLFSHQLPIDPISYLQKVLIFILTLLIAVIIYVYIVKRWSLFNKIRSLEMSFNGAVLGIVLFFSFAVLYLKWSIH